MERVSSFFVWCDTEPLGTAAGNGPMYRFRNGMSNFKLMELLVYGSSIWNDTNK
jgi:hypothetical protein